MSIYKRAIDASKEQSDIDLKKAKLRFKSKFGEEPDEIYNHMILKDKLGFMFDIFDDHDCFYLAVYCPECKSYQILKVGEKAKALHNLSELGAQLINWGIGSDAEKVCDYCMQKKAPVTTVSPAPTKTYRGMNRGGG